METEGGQRGGDEGKEGKMTGAGRWQLRGGGEELNLRCVTTASLWPQ